MHYNFGTLLDQINTIVNKPNVEDLRVGAIINLRHVYRLIGVELIADDYNFEIDVKNGKWFFPEEMVLLVDVGTEPYTSNGTMIGQGYAPCSYANFRMSALGLSFPGLVNAKLYGTGYRFFKDEEGQNLIPDEIFTACKEYCTAEALIASNNPKNPAWQNRYDMKRRAEIVDIPTARGLVNQVNPARYRTQIKLS